MGCEFEWSKWKHRNESQGGLGNKRSWSTKECLEREIVIWESKNGYI